MTWPNAKIKEVALVVTGKTPSKKVSEYFGGDIPFVTPSELSQVYVETAPVTLTKLGAQTIKLVPTNSIMVCCIGSLGKTAIAARELATNQQINTVIFDNTRVFPKYGYYALQRLKPMMDHVAPSTTVAIINKSRFESFEIPLPPLEEQKRIAAILDKADAVRRKRQQAIELADKFLQSVFLDMFGDPVTNPKGFEVSEIGIECEIKGGKRIPKGDTLVRYDTGFPYIKAGNIKDGEVTGKHLEYVTPEVRDKIKRYTVNKGDICITVVGANIGDVGIVPEELHLASLTENANKILINDKNRLRTDYLAEALTTDFIQKQIKQKTMAVGVPKLALFRIQQLKILVPPIEVQKDFEKRKRLLVGLLKKSNENLSASERIFTSLSQQAFKGELTKDEAA